ncbi:MAG: hypothetical protein Q9159_001235 [Coniocarpon cinnabarinum]
MHLVSARAELADALPPSKAAKRVLEERHDEAEDSGRRLVTDPLTNLEHYVIRDSAGRVSTVPTSAILRHVSAAELERFDCKQAELRAEEEEIGRRALIANHTEKRRPGRPPKREHYEDTEDSRKDCGNTCISSSRFASNDTTTPASHTSHLADLTEKHELARDSQTFALKKNSPSVPSGGNHGERTNKRARFPSAITVSKQYCSDLSHNKLPPNSIHQDLKPSPRSSEFSAPDSSSHRQLSESPDQAIDDEVYEVEAIQSDHVIDGKQYYITKWVGYDDTTEEPAENLSSAQDVLREYWFRRSRSEYAVRS